MKTCRKHNNFTLIGMAGVGKSYTGKILANTLGFENIETDHLIKQEANRLGINVDLLPDNEFIKMEEKVILGLINKNNAVIDTGGSAVYSERAMNLLKSISKIIYLKDTIANIKQRFDVRGEMHLIGIRDRTFEELFAERSKLYEKYADIVIDTSRNKDINEIIKIILGPKIRTDL
jgi:shikimate kinase